MVFFLQKRLRYMEVNEVFSFKFMLLLFWETVRLLSLAAPFLGERVIEQNFLRHNII